MFFIIIYNIISILLDEQYDTQKPVQETIQEMSLVMIDISSEHLSASRLILDIE